MTELNWESKFMRYQKITLTLILVTLGALGTALFFPLQLKESHTCLYHRIFAPEEKQSEPAMLIYQSEVSLAGTINTVASEHYQKLLHRYLVPFGLLWWLSLSFLAVGIFLLKRVGRSANNQNYFHKK